MNDFKIEILLGLITLIGVIIAFTFVRAYLIYREQCKLENTFALLDFLRKRISDKQIATFVKLFHANNELSGVNYNEFKFSDGTFDTIETMFSEGGCGNGDIYNLITTFNLIVPSLKNIEESYVWYEYGQIMVKLYAWTNYIQKNAETDLQEEGYEFYSAFNHYMERYARSIINVKHYTNAE